MSAVVLACLSMLAVAVMVSVVVGSTPLSGAALADGSQASSSAPGTGSIPLNYLQDFEAASQRYHVDWGVLAGIYRLECDFGSSRESGCVTGTANALGAQGPGQFLPGTWRRGLPAGGLIPVGPPAPDGSGFATDGDGDGLADVWDPADAVASTARLLQADGADRDLRAAVFAYNHDDSYVARVLALASSYEAGSNATAGGTGIGSFVPGAASSAVLSFARSQIGVPYRWGGAGPDGWDCSGLVQAALGLVGVRLAHNAALQYAETEGSPATGVIEPGDLVFYGASAVTIHHVGIAIDQTQMIDAPYTGAVVRVDPIAAPDFFAATRPVG